MGGGNDLHSFEEEDENYEYDDESDDDESSDDSHNNHKKKTGKQQNKKKSSENDSDEDGDLNNLNDNYEQFSDGDEGVETEEFQNSNKVLAGVKLGGTASL